MSGKRYSPAHPELVERAPLRYNFSSGIRATYGQKVANIVGVRFKGAGRVHYFDPADLDLAVGDRVVVETEDGPREGQVAISPSQVIHSDLRGPLFPVLRTMGPQ